MNESGKIKWGNREGRGGKNWIEWISGLAKEKAKATAIYFESIVRAITILFSHIWKKSPHFEIKVLDTTKYASATFKSGYSNPIYDGTMETGVFFNFKDQFISVLLNFVAAVRLFSN